MSSIVTIKMGWYIFTIASILFSLQKTLLYSVLLFLWETFIYSCSQNFNYMRSLWMTNYNCYDSWFRQGISPVYSSSTPYTHTNNVCHFLHLSFAFFALAKTHIINKVCLFVCLLLYLCTPNEINSLSQSFRTRSFYCIL